MFPALEILFKGIVLGLTISLPIGPGGILLVSRTLKRGILSGFFSGIGLATADTILAIVAGLGFTFLISFFQDEKLIISFIAGMVILGVGIKISHLIPLKNSERGKRAIIDFYGISFLFWLFLYQIPLLYLSLWLFFPVLI